MQIHHEWVLVGWVSGRVKHSWRRAGESVGAGLIYRDVRLLGEGRVQLGLILAQQGCQRSVASSPLTPGRGAAGPPRERNRGVTPRPGAPQPRAGWPQVGQCQPSSQGEMLGALCQARLLVWLESSRTGSSAHPACAPPTMSSAQQGPLLSGDPSARPGGSASLLQPPPQAPQEPGTCPAGPQDRPHAPTHHGWQGSALPCAPYLRRRLSGLLQGPPEKRCWLKGAEGGRLFTASSHGRIGDVGRRMGTQDLRLQAGQDTSTFNPARRTAGHGTPTLGAARAPNPPRPGQHHPNPLSPHSSACCSLPAGAGMLMTRTLAAPGHRPAPTPPPGAALGGRLGRARPPSSYPVIVPPLHGQSHPPCKTQTPNEREALLFGTEKSKQ